MRHSILVIAVVAGALAGCQRYRGCDDTVNYRSLPPATQRNVAQDRAQAWPSPYTATNPDGQRTYRTGAWAGSGVDDQDKAVGAIVAPVQAAAIAHDERLYRSEMGGFGSILDDKLLERSQTMVREQDAALERR